MATIYNTATSLDGFLATTDHSLQWLFDVPGADDEEPGIADFLAGVGALAMGRSTYEWVVEHESLLERPDTWTAWYGDRPTWVFTTRDLPVVEGADIRFTRAPVVDVHAEMVAAAGDRDVWLMGGGDLVGQFADAGLLDRVTVTIAPVTLGAGAPLLPRDIRSDRLALRSVERRGPFAELTYDVGPAT
ncbi:dihydrofolate reductase family protein [Aeromicrobium fastidiosum]|uniref:Dihydrofolate reductase n=1 Tax=Aeromicrobium fastidiosum TaxID=52699 RepID=A0A641ANT7_9ACTN|nr:dihydrofolate reductase family protein [Aeromicrobium fastidiosum]KAA1379750.1 dihydrofolate reductase [Aeromicrobium fastidiosum]MBP2389238.1 dihydrofolate reductase [Aeromicrobium fastidiosum]